MVESRRSRRSSRGRRRERRNVPRGIAHIQSTFNNTIVTITDPEGTTIAWASGGSLGFPGSRKSTPFAAGLTAEQAARRAMENGMRQIDVRIKGPGAGREIGDPFTPSGRLGRHQYRRHHPGTAQWAAATEAPEGLAPARVARGARRRTHMARYTGPVCKLCRREGMKLFLKGDRCLTPKCAISRRNAPPGPRPQRRPAASE